MQIYSGTAGATVPVRVNHGTALLTVSGLANAETASLQVYNGSAYQAYEDPAGTAVVLNATKHNYTIPTAGLYQLVITASAGTAKATLTTW